MYDETEQKVHSLVQHENSICKPLNIIYERYVDKQDLKAMLSFVSGVKYWFCFCLYDIMYHILQLSRLNTHFFIPYIISHRIPIVIFK